MIKNRSQWKKLAPAMYSDPAGQIHIDIPEMLAHFGMPDTEANRAEMTQLAQNSIRELLPKATTEVRSGPGVN
jgi:hypothetical protein